MNRPEAGARLALGLVVALIGALVLGADFAVAQVQEVAIGVMGPLTGNYAPYGISLANGAELAINEANASGRYDVRFVLKKADTRAEQMQGLHAVNKLIDFDRVTAFVGPIMSHVALTAGPIAQDAGVPFITVATAPSVSEIGDYQFRNMFTDDVQAAQMAEYAVQVLGLRRFAILYTNNDYGVALRRAFEAAARAAGAQVVAVESFLDGDTNFSAQMTNIATRNPDGLYIAGYYTEAALIAQQAAFQGMRVQILGPDSFDSPALIELGGPAVEGALFTSSFFPDIGDELTRDFVEKYQATYGAKPDLFAASVYDSTWILIHVISKVGTDRAKIRDGIAAIKDFPGVTGVTSFAPNGDVIKALHLIRVQDQTFVRER